MLKVLFPLIPLLLSAGILLGGTGLLGTFVPIRAGQEGFSPIVIGLFGSAFFAGFLAGCLVVVRMIAKVGHIRSFAVLAALCASATILHALAINPYLWLVARAIVGFAIAGLFMAVESWLAERAPKAERGRVLGIYRVVDLSFVTVGQFILPWVGPEGFTLFGIIAILYCLALIPISLMDAPAPKVPEYKPLKLSEVWKISPLAVLAAVTTALTNSAFRQVGPLYASELGLDLTQVATFMTMAIVGGAISPIPLGWMSDRISRRWVILGTTGIAALAGLYLSFIPASDPYQLYIGSLMFGAFAMPLWSLSLAHAADFAKPGAFIHLSAGLSIYFGLAAIFGPIISALVIDQLGAQYFFSYTTLVHASLIVFALYRMQKRPGPEKKRPFRAFNRTSAGIFRLGKRR